jgi:FlaA1/EpsC-like NDP-sugar epimerase
VALLKERSVRKSVVLITGAGGEIGHGLIDRLAETGRHDIVTLDVKPLDGAVKSLVQQQFVGSILDNR